MQLSIGGVHAPNVQSAAHTRVPVDPQAVVHVATVPSLQSKPSSIIPSQSSSRRLQLSTGGVHAPQAHPLPQVRVPTLPQTVVQLPSAPAQHAPTPSSQTPSQSSSIPLQTSAGGVHACHEHEPLQLRVPVEPQVVSHDPVEPAQHADVSSQIVSQSSSVPLHTSTGGVQVPHSQPEVQVCVPPGVPHALVQARVAPGTQVKPSSIVPSQSSSAPLHTSAGGTQASNTHIELQTCVPVEPQVVVHDCISAGEHSTVSSTSPSQSSSTPLHPSAGGSHTLPIVHVVPSQVRVPVESQEVVQVIVLPATHSKVSSGAPLQSSSTPLHTSAGATQSLQVQSVPHVRVPVVPQEVVQLSDCPCTHANTSSGAPLQSSSAPLQSSAGGEHTLHPQVTPHTRVPVVPQSVGQSITAPRQQVKVSSHSPLQSSSSPLQTSGAPGKESGLASLQSVAGTPPTSGHVASPKVSPSESRVVYAQTPRSQ